MDDSTLFMQWAMDTLQHQHPVAIADDCGETTFPSLQALRDATHATVLVQELMTEAHAANSWSSGETTQGGGENISAPGPGSHGAPRLPPSPNSTRYGPTSSSSGTNLPVTSWNFSTASAQPGSDGMLEDTATAPRSYDSGVPELVYGSASTRRSAVRSTGPTSSAPYAQDHIIAERKRREKINQRFIELATVIPGLKKMDKATILSDAAAYVKELQERLKALEAAGSNCRSIETVLLVKKPCLASAGENGSPSSASSGWPAARNSLPEIEARFSENSVMLRIHCENGKGVVVKVLAGVEDLHLGIIHTNVMPFPACTVIITIMAKQQPPQAVNGWTRRSTSSTSRNSTAPRKHGVDDGEVEEGFTVTAEEIVGRLNSALQQHSRCRNTTQEAGN